MNQEQQVKLANEICSHYYFNHYLKNLNPEFETISLKEKREVFSYQYKMFKDKWFKYFLKTIELFGERKEFKPIEFIDDVLAENFLYPTQLPFEKNWKIYQRNNQELDYVLNPVMGDIKKAKEFFVFLGNRKISDLTNSYILSQDLVKQYAEDTLDLTVLCFSKAFKEFAKKSQMIIDFKEEQSKIDIRLKNKIKEKLNDDFEEEE